MAEMTESFHFGTYDGMWNVEWKIRRFFGLPHSANYSLSSPIFMLSDAKWFIEMCPNGDKKKSHGWVSLYLYKEDSPTNISVNYSIGIKKADGSLLTSVDCWFAFKKKYNGWGAGKIIQRSELLDTNIMAPGGILTVFCSIRSMNGVTAARVGASPQASSSYVCFLPKLELKDYDGIIKELEDKLSLSQKEKEEVVEDYQKKLQEFKHGDQTLPQNFKELYLSGYRGDVTFRVNDKDFVAHRLVLAARSPVFRAMFESDMTEKNNDVVNIEDCEPEIFEDFLLFLYSGEFGIVTVRNALKLCLIADKYSLKELVKSCFECLAREISIDSVCDAAYLATLYNDRELLDVSTIFFIDNMDKIVSTPKWLSFLSEHPTFANELFVEAASKSKNNNKK